MKINQKAFILNNRKHVTDNKKDNVANILGMFAGSVGIQKNEEIFKTLSLK